MAGEAASRYTARVDAVLAQRTRLAVKGTGRLPSLCSAGEPMPRQGVCGSLEPDKT
jgi:hypothetical protein